MCVAFRDILSVIRQKTAIWAEARAPGRAALAFDKVHEGIELGNTKSHEDREKGWCHNSTASCYFALLFG